MKRDDSVSFLKGIGIISVVLGHVCSAVIPVVYIYHLAIFFFVSGYTYNAEKYRNKQEILFANRMNSIMPVYLIYTTVLIVSHNIFMRMGIYTDEFSMSDILQKICLALSFIYNEPISPAVWFIPVSIVAVVIFGRLSDLSLRISEILGKSEIVILTFFSVICGIFGIVCVINGGILAWRLEISFCMIPVLLAGFIYRKNLKWVNELLKYIYCIPCILFCYFIISYYEESFDFSHDKILNPIVFYPLIFAGIFCCLLCEKLLRHMPTLYNLIKYVGNYSLDIMLMHIVPVKIVDYFYLTFINKEAGQLSNMVYSVPSLWPVYTIVGVVVPIFIRRLFNACYRLFKCKLEHVNYTL